MTWSCPLCRQPTVWKGNPWRPFCSERCQLTDLGTWAAEQYRVPGQGLSMELPTHVEEENGDRRAGTEFRGQARPK